jgi:hypothetical protein
MVAWLRPAVSASKSGIAAGRKYHPPSLSPPVLSHLTIDWVSKHDEQGSYVVASPALSSLKLSVLPIFSWLPGPRVYIVRVPPLVGLKPSHPTFSPPRHNQYNIHAHTTASTFIYQTCVAIVLGELSLISKFPFTLWL